MTTTVRTHRPPGDGIEIVPETSARPARDPLVVLVGLEAAALVPAFALSSSSEVRALRTAIVLAAALLVWSAARVGRRWEAAAAVAFGATGMAIGAAVGAPHVAKLGATPTGIAGVVAFVAGLGLFVLGIPRLLRGLPRWRWPVGVIGVLLVLQFGVQPLFAAVAITHPPRTPAGERTPASVGLGYEDVTFSASDGVAVAASYVPSRNGAAVVAVPGSGSERSATVDHAAVLARRGYGVVLIDPRGHGRSDGEAMDTGWFTPLDIGAAVTFLTGRPEVDDDRIGLLGLSMGGEAAITAAAADPRIRAVVGEGVERRTAADHVESKAGVAGVVERISITEQFTIADLLTGASSPPPLVDAVRATAPRPVLLIAAGGEEAGARRYRAAAPDSVELWELPDTGHTAGLATHPDEWAARVLEFFDRTLA